jgi:hypothetical protein
MKKLTLNDNEIAILNIALGTVLHLDILTESDKETAKILLLALGKL